MKKIPIGIAAVTALIGTSVSASAQSTESQSTNDILRRLQTLEASNAALAKENAALRVENTKLQGRVREQKGSNETATAQQTSTTSASALNRTSSKAALYDKASSPMVVKAPPVAPVPVWSWTGCYAGVNGGYAWNTGKTHYDDPNTTPDPINFIGGSIANTFVPAPSGTGAGGLGGIGVGCNWQSQQWVYGVEADVDVGHIAGSQTNSVGGTISNIVAITPILFLAGSPTATASEHTELNWLSTIRGRVGFTVLDRLLLFATGGLAIGEAHSDGSVTVANTNPLTLTPVEQINWSGSHSEVKAGFTVGGGAEWAFADRWTAKAEYLWYDLGNVSHPLACAGGTVPFGAQFFTCTSNPGLFPTLGNAVSALHGSIVRVGINYRFN